MTPPTPQPQNSKEEKLKKKIKELNKQIYGLIGDNSALKSKLFDMEKENGSK